MLEDYLRDFYHSDWHDDFIPASSDGHSEAGLAATTPPEQTALSRHLLAANAPPEQPEPGETMDGKLASVKQNLPYKKCAAAHETAQLPRKRAQENQNHYQMAEEATTSSTMATTNKNQNHYQMAEEDIRSSIQRRKAREDEAWLAANEAEAKKAETARAKKEADEAHEKCLRAIIQNRRELDQQKMKNALAKAHLRYIQVTFPAQLAEHHIRCFAKLNHAQKKKLKNVMEQALKDKLFERHPYVPHLWPEDSRVPLIKLALVQPPGAHGPDGKRHWVRCASTFELEVRKNWTECVKFGMDPIEALRRLLAAFVPCHDKIFTGAYTPLRLLHMNDYVMEKAFVFAVIALSKWLGPKRWPPGFYDTWPPPLPPPEAKAAEAAVVVDVDADTGSTGSTSIGKAPTSTSTGST